MLQPDAIDEPIPTENVNNSNGNIATKDRQPKSLLAIKLTGDSNIPRWQYSFVVPDLLETGLLRIAEEEEFRGSRVVRSALHLAAKDFRLSELLILFPKLVMES